MTVERTNEMRAELEAIRAEEMREHLDTLAQHDPWSSGLLTSGARTEKIPNMALPRKNPLWSKAHRCYLCPSCETEVTSTDFEVGACTNCGQRLHDCDETCHGCATCYTATGDGTCRKLCGHDVDEEDEEDAA